MKQLLAADLFTGAGGMSLGFKQTGKITTLFAVENNKNAKKTYQRNFKEVSKENVLDNILNVNFQVLANNLLSKGQTVDLVIGGPPCQGFSNANRQKNDLVSSNNQLVKHYLRAIEHLNPKAFVMENVKMMGSKKHKFFYSKRDQEEIQKLKLEQKIKLEEFPLAKSTLFDAALIQFVTDNQGYAEYCLQKDIYLNFINLLRNSTEEVKFKRFMEKNSNKFHKILSSWESFHSHMWSDAYGDFWSITKQDILAYFNSFENYQRLISSISTIVEVQKVLHKMQEVEMHEIEHEPLVLSHNLLSIKLRTYNVLEYVTAKLNSLDYIIDKGILNSAHFGVAQERERLFIIGVKKEQIAEGKQVLLPTGFLQNKQDFYTVKDAISDLETPQPKKEVYVEPLEREPIQHGHPLTRYLNDQNELYNHIITATREQALKRFEKLGQGQNFHDLKDEDKTTYTDPSRTQNTIYQKLDYNYPSGTVLNVRKSMWIHPSEARAISIREAARLQSFPDSFVFEGTKDSQYQQIGNAVPPLLGRAVAEQLLDIMGINVEKKLETWLHVKEVNHSSVSI